MLNNIFYAQAGQNTFTLSFPPANNANLVVLYNGVVQSNTTYHIANNLLIFNTPAQANDVFQAQEDLILNLNPTVFEYYEA